MKLPTCFRPSSSGIVSLLFLLLFSAPLQGAQFEEEVSSTDYLFVEGIIRPVSPEEQTITLKQKKQPKITISIAPHTIFEAFYQLTPLPLRQKIKIWYQPEEKNNRALKILKPLDLGC